MYPSIPGALKLALQSPCFIFMAQGYSHCQSLL